MHDCTLVGKQVMRERLRLEYVALHRGIKDEFISTSAMLVGFTGLMTTYLCQFNGTWGPPYVLN